MRGQSDKRRHGGRGAIARALLASTALVLVTLPAAAQGVAQNWTGAAGDNWFDPGNWDSGTVPFPPPAPVPPGPDSVTLDTVTPNATVVDGGAFGYTDTELNGLNVGYLASGALTVRNGANFSVIDSLAVIGGDLNGNTITATGAVVLDGAGTRFNVTGSPPGGGTIFVGASGTGSFTVQNGAVVSTVDSYVGHFGTAVGTATVTGATSQWNNSGDSFVGNYGNGVFNVESGGAVTVAGNTIIGAEPGGVGTLNISGAGSSWITAGATALGGGIFATNGGSGTINVSTGAGYVASNDTVIGFKSGGSGAVNLSTGATFLVNSNANVFLGFATGTTGTVTIDNATWDASVGGDMVIGGNSGFGAGAGGTGVVTVRNGGSLTMQGVLYLGRGTTGGDGTLNVDGAGSTVALSNTNDALFVGHTGTGAMNITNGGQVTNAGFAYVGYLAGATGVVNIDGANSTWTNTGPLLVGGNPNSVPGGNGTINVSNGGRLNTGNAALGYDSATMSVGTVNVTGAASRWDAADVIVGYDSIGILNVAAGGTVRAANLTLGDCNCANGTVNVSGGSTLEVTNDLYIGFSGVGAMNVSGPGTTVTVANNFAVSLGADATMTISNGAAVTGAFGLFVGLNPGTRGTVTVTGANSLLSISGGNLFVGSANDTGTLNILDGGRVEALAGFLSDDRVTIGAGSVLVANGLGLSGTATTSFGIRGASSGQIDGSAGVAFIDGALVVTGRNIGRTTYTLLTSGGLGGTTFATVTYDPLLRNPVLTYTLTDVLLTVDAFQLALAVPSNGTANQRHVARAFDSAIAAGATLPPAFENVFMLSGDALLNALSQLSGEPGGGVQQSAMMGAGMFMNSVFDNAFGAPAGSAGQAAALGYASQPRVPAVAREAYAAVTPRDRKPSSTMASFESRWSVWAAGYGGSARVLGDGVTGSHDTTSRVYGVTAGATWRLSSDTQLGFALGGAGSNFSVAQGFGSGKADAFNAAFYGRHAIGTGYVAAALGYSWQDATTDRTVSAGGTTEILHAAFRPQALTMRLEGGRRFVTTMFGVTPYAALQTTTLFMPAYAETATAGAGVFALSYGARTFTATRGELGARFDKTMLLNGSLLTLKAKAAWAHDWNTERLATATFQQLPGATFTVNGAAPAANAALLSFGADLALGGGWTLGAGFDGEFSRTTASYSGKGSLRYAW